MGTNEFGGIHMRKVALLAALLIAAAFSSASVANAQAKENPAAVAGRNTAKFLHDATFPYSVTAKPAAAPKAAKKGKKKR